MGVSALPVLARILAERRMLQQSLGVVTMAATAIGIIISCGIANKLLISFAQMT